MNEFDDLLTKIREIHENARKQASLAETASNLSPGEELGPRIKKERKRQGLTLKELCDLSDVAYSTLVKLEKGNPSARLDIVNRVLNTLGLKLWVGPQTSTIKDAWLES